MPFREAVDPEIGRLPRLGHEIRIREIFEHAAERIGEIPEIGRRNRMAPGADRGFPAERREVLAAAEDLVNVMHLEGDVVQIGDPARQPQHEEIVMISAWRIAQEGRRTPGIAIGEAEAEALAIKALGLRDIGHGEDDVADAKWMRALIHRAWRIDAAARARHVKRQRRALRLFAMAPNADADIDAAIIDRVDGAVAIGSDVAILGEFLAETINIALRLDAPDHFAEFALWVELRREILGPARADDDLASDLGREDEPRLAVL